MTKANAVAKVIMGLGAVAYAVPALAPLIKIDTGTAGAIVQFLGALGTMLGALFHTAPGEPTAWVVHPAAPAAAAPLIVPGPTASGTITSNAK